MNEAQTHAEEDQVADWRKDSPTGVSIDSNGRAQVRRGGPQYPGFPNPPKKLTDAEKDRLLGIGQAAPIAPRSRVVSRETLRSFLQGRPDFAGKDAALRGLDAGLPVVLLDTYDHSTICTVAPEPGNTHTALEVYAPSQRVEIEPLLTPVAQVLLDEEIPELLVDEMVEVATDGGDVPAALIEALQRIVAEQIEQDKRARRRGIIQLTMRDLAVLLDLPVHMDVVGFFVEPKTNYVGVIVRSDFLGEVPELCEPPVLERNDAGDWL